MGEGCELWGGNERKKWDGWGGMYVCGGEEEKRKAEGYMGGGGKKRKRNREWGLHVWWEKSESGKESRKKKLKRKNLNLFYLYVHFVWYKV